jgi:hypothetical protein
MEIEEKGAEHRNIMDFIFRYAVPFVPYFSKYYKYHGTLYLSYVTLIPQFYSTSL